MRYIMRYTFPDPGYSVRASHTLWMYAISCYVRATYGSQLRHTRTIAAHTHSGQKFDLWPPRKFHLGYHENTSKPLHINMYVLYVRFTFIYVSSTRIYRISWELFIGKRSISGWISLLFFFCNISWTLTTVKSKSDHQHRCLVLSARGITRYLGAQFPLTP